MEKDGFGCVVLAAGAGERFGGGKLLAEYRGKPLYLSALEAVPTGSVGAAAVVSGDETILAAAGKRGFLPVVNARPEEGISRSIRLGLDALGDCGGILFLVADQPRLTRQTAERILETAGKHPECIIVPTDERGTPGNPCFFPKEYFPELRALEGDRGGRRVIASHPEAVVTVAVPAAELADTDTPEQLRELEKI